MIYAGRYSQHIHIDKRMNPHFHCSLFQDLSRVHIKIA